MQLNTVNFLCQIYITMAPHYKCLITLDKGSSKMLQISVRLLFYCTARMTTAVEIVNNNKWQ